MDWVIQTLSRMVVFDEKNNVCWIKKKLTITMMLARTFWNEVKLSFLIKCVPNAGLRNKGT